MDRKNIEELWYQYFVLKQNPDLGLSKKIAESWKRSRDLEIDCFKLEASPEDAVARRHAIERNGDFIKLARPYITNLYKTICSSNFSITLLDRKGYMIDMISNPVIAEGSGISLACLHEKRIGTNAMGTCLVLDEPIQTVGEEHFYKKFHKFTTSAAPIHDAGGSLIGCIGITGFAEMVSSHTLGMAIAIAYAIENDIKSTEKHKSLAISKDRGVKENTEHYTFQDIIGNSAEIEECIYLGKIAAMGKSNVLIMGESGTGKELLAQSIHNYSSRRDKPFVAINCGALPQGLAESELFGYEGGAYTGARREGQPGKFEFANGGTLFLDEIGEMPLALQASLLRVIQERTVTRIGGNQSRRVDVMVIAATNKNLLQAVREGAFRADLFYRLNVFFINLPSLRDHPEDIPLLAQHFINRYNLSFSKHISGLSEEAMTTLMNYSWPGNIRELENTIERAVLIAKEDTICKEHLPIYMLQEIERFSPEHREAVKIGELRQRENELLVEILKGCGGNIKRASERLGISRATLYRKLKALSIDISFFRDMG